MIDAWSRVPPGNGAPADPAGAVTDVVTAVTTGPDHLRAFTQTGEVPKVGAGSPAGAAVPEPTATAWPGTPDRHLSLSSPATTSGRASGRWPRPGAG